MAEIARIKTPNGVEHSFKDSESRDAISRTLNKVKTVVCIGDSYGVDTDWWTGWQTAFSNLNTFFVYKSAVGGSGIIGDPSKATFLQQLQTLSASITNKNEVTDIVFMGGYNDVSLSYSEAQLLQGMGQITAYCRANYPFAKIHYGYVAVSYRTTTTQATIAAYEPVFKRICTKFMVHYIPNARYILMNKSYIFLDESNANWGFHPSTNGAKAIAEFLLIYLCSGYADVVYREDITGIGHVEFKNGDVILYPGNVTRYPFYSYLTAGTYTNNTWYDLYNLKSNNVNLLWGPYNESYAYVASIIMLGGTNMVGNGNLRIYQKKIQFKFIDTSHTLSAAAYIPIQSLYIPEHSNFT